MIQIVIVIAFTTLIIRVLLSFKTKRDDYSKSMEELKREFKKKDILLLLGFFVLIPLLVIGLTILYSRLSEVQFSQDEEIIYLLKSNIGNWILTGIMSSVGVGMCLVVWITNKVFKERIDDYWIYYNRKYGFNAAGFLKYFSILIMFSGSLLACMSYNYFVKIKNDTIEINRLTSLLPEKYSFDSIEQINHYQKTIAPNGNVVDKPYYAIVFNDNSVWSTIDDLRSTNKSDKEMIEFVSFKSSIEITELDSDTK